jgi:hypothetical protein
LEITVTNDRFAGAAFLSIKVLPCTFPETVQPLQVSYAAPLGCATKRKRNILFHCRHNFPQRDVFLSSLLLLIGYNIGLRERKLAYL